MPPVRAAFSLLCIFVQFKGFPVFRCVWYIYKLNRCIVVFQNHFFYFSKINAEEFFSRIHFVYTLVAKVLMQDSFQSGRII